MKITLYVRALRLEFVICSVLPFMAGSFLASNHVPVLHFSLGLLAVVCAHVSANLINDYADSRSGVDWQDMRYFCFFGGSKLIQEGRLTEGWYLRMAWIFAGIASEALITLTFLRSDSIIMSVGIVALLLAWQYSKKPCQFSHHRLGEVVIFLLFGVLPVCAGYYLGTGRLFPLHAVIASLPFGFLIAIVLYANEIPDYQTDHASGKNTLVSVTGPVFGYVGYGVLQAGMIISLIVCVMHGIYPLWILWGCLCIMPALIALVLIKKYPYNKHKLRVASMLTIVEHVGMGIMLVIGSR